MASEFGELPQHMQVMVTGAVVLVGSAWGVLKFIKPFFDQITPKPATSSTDAVVVSAALADSKPMYQLAQSIDALNATQEKTNILLGMIYEGLVRLNTKV